MYPLAIGGSQAGTTSLASCSSAALLLCPPRLSYCEDGKYFADATQSFSTPSGPAPIISPHRRTGTTEAARQERACSGTYDGTSIFFEQPTVRARGRLLTVFYAHGFCTI